MSAATAHDASGAQSLPAAPEVWGILNVTPDSFSDGGAYLDPQRAVDRARSLAADGAHVIDVGGESTRPGSQPVTPAVEQSRVLPVIAALAAEGLSVRVEDAGPADAQPADGPATFTLHLVGQDHPGIVAEISSALAARGVRIEELLTDVVDAPMGGGTLFEARATLRMPPGADAEVRADLERLADELMVDLELDPARTSR